jgi:multidrug efflux pump subunit AcrB
MVMLTAPLGLVGIVPMLLAFNQPFGFNAILGLIGLAGILMRNTLILTEQIKENRAAGLDDYHAVIEATVQRTRPVILTALAAVLAFIPLTHSVFWGSMAYTLIGGTAVGTVLILLFLPALYAAWFGSSRLQTRSMWIQRRNWSCEQQWLPSRGLLQEETLLVLARRLVLLHMLVW